MSAADSPQLARPPPWSCSCLYSSTTAERRRAIFAIRLHVDKERYAVEFQRNPLMCSPALLNIMCSPVLLNIQRLTLLCCSKWKNFKRSFFKWPNFRSFFVNSFAIAMLFAKYFRILVFYWLHVFSFEMAQLNCQQMFDMDLESMWRMSGTEMTQDVWAAVRVSVSSTVAAAGYRVRKFDEVSADYLFVYLKISYLLFDDNGNLLIQVSTFTGYSLSKCVRPRPWANVKCK